MKGFDSLGKLQHLSKGCLELYKRSGIIVLYCNARPIALKDTSGLYWITDSKLDAEERLVLSKWIAEAEYDYVTQRTIELIANKEE